MGMEMDMGSEWGELMRDGLCESRALKEGKEGLTVLDVRNSN